jgi:hypothetical protein
MTKRGRNAFLRELRKFRRLHSSFISSFEPMSSVGSVKQGEARYVSLCSPCLWRVIADQIPDVFGGRFGGSANLHLAGPANTGRNPSALRAMGFASCALLPRA